jgi:predicted DNA-binding transcriptional regulator YafY
VDDGTFHTVLTALANRHRLRIDYNSRSRPSETGTLISPQRLTLYRSNWYLAAWSHGHDQLRIYAVDRLTATERTTLACHEVAGRTLERRLGSSYGIFEGEPTHTAVLRFTAVAARWVADEQWHPDQQAHVLADGRWELRIPYHDATELKMDILRFGAEVEVITPASLRKDIIRMLDAARSVY